MVSMRKVSLRFWFHGDKLSRPPQAGSKSVATWKYRNRTDTSQSFPYIYLYMTIVWRLVIRGNERWGRHLFEFSWRL